MQEAGPGRAGSESWGLVGAGGRSFDSSSLSLWEGVDAQATQKTSDKRNSESHT